MDHQTRETGTAEPGALLAAYLESGRKESAFVELVERLGGLVFASAHRRTGDRSLAQEVSQNVFAILARKAGSLRSHPNLPAWVFRTTQLESDKAMRSEQRHKRKIAAFASEADRLGTGEAAAEPAWLEALPALDASLDQLAAKDRTLIFDRFFARKPFAEIARETGKTEAACKMQVKRALEKLAVLLRSRGVALSAPVLAAGLSAEFAKAAPMAAPSLAAKALAASGSVSITTLFSNTLLTMSSAKSSAIAAAAVVLASLFPILRQQGEAARLRSEIATLEMAAVSEIPSRTSLRTAARDARATRTLRQNLENDRQPVAVGPLLDDLMKVMMEQDIAGLIRVLTPVARMTPAEYARLMEDLEVHDASPEAKSTALMILTSFAPQTDFRERLESLIRQGAAPGMLGEPLRLWAASDPDAALAWFESARADGQLLGKGVNSDPAPGMFAEILVALATTHPDRALELAASMPRNEREKFRIDDKLAAAFAQASLKSGDTRHLDRLIADATDHGERYRMVNAVANAIGETGGLDAVRAFLARTMPEDGSEAIDNRMLTLLSDATRMPFADRAEWIVRHADAEEAGEKLHYIITNEIRLGDSVNEWIRSQPPGTVRDQAQAAHAEVTAIRSGHLAGLEVAELIADPDLKLTTRRAIAEAWLKMSPDAARKGLPADLLPERDR